MVPGGRFKRIKRISLEGPRGTGLGKRWRDYILQGLEREGLVSEQTLNPKPGDLGVKHSSTTYWL